jgi:integrase
MPIMQLTKRSVDAAVPELGPDGKPRRTIYFDRTIKGFGLLVTESGSKSFVVKYRAGKGRIAPTRRYTIGRYGSPWTVEMARDEAKRLLGVAAQGGDPAAERSQLRKGGAQVHTLTQVAEEWLERDQAGNRSRAEVERIMRRDVLPVLGARLVDAIRKRDIIDLIDGIADRGAPTMANRVLAHVKRLFRWAAGRDIIETDPAAHVEKPTPERRRERVLSDDELMAVWRAAERMSGPFGAGVRLLIATGARREEVFGLRWPELDREHAVVRLPPERNKVAEERLIPLSPLASAVIDSLPKVVPPARTSTTETDGEPEVVPCVLTTNGRVPFANIGRSKAALDTAIATARRNATKPSRQGEPLTDEERKTHALPGWRLHDLRRTVATGMQRLGVRLEVIEAVLGHVSGTRAGIVGIYQRHRFTAEAREALAAWGAHIERLLAGGTRAKVVPLRRTR